MKCYSRLEVLKLKKQENSEFTYLISMECQYNLIGNLQSVLKHHNQSKNNFSGIANVLAHD